jgi:hypothetical protein
LFSRFSGPVCGPRKLHQQVAIRNWLAMFWCARCSGGVHEIQAAQFSRGKFFPVFNQISFSPPKERGLYLGANCAGALIAKELLTAASGFLNRLH